MNVQQGWEGRGSGWMGVVGLTVLMCATPSHADDAIEWVNSRIPGGVMATDEKQCSGLNERWLLLREDINKKHKACLTEQTEAAKNNHIKYGRSVPKLTEDGNRCTYEVCEGLHSVLFGRKAQELREIQSRQTKACRENVQLHQKYKKENPADVEKERERVRNQLKELQKEPQEEASLVGKHAKEGLKQAGKYSGAVSCGLSPSNTVVQTAGGLGCSELGERAGEYSGNAVEEYLEADRTIKNICRNRDNVEECENYFLDQRVKERREKDELRELRRK